MRCNNKTKCLTVYIMKLYNLSQIMKQAWREYKYVAKKKGISFGECLKKSWRIHKELISFNKEKKNREAIYNKECESKFADAAVSTPSKEYNDLSIHSNAFYSNNRSGRFGSHFCND